MNVLESFMGYLGHVVDHRVRRVADDRNVALGQAERVQVGLQQRPAPDLSRIQQVDDPAHAWVVVVVFSPDVFEVDLLRRRDGVRAMVRQDHVVYLPGADGIGDDVAVGPDPDVHVERVAEGFEHGVGAQRAVGDCGPVRGVVVQGHGTRVWEERATNH